MKKASTTTHSISASAATQPAGAPPVRGANGKRPNGATDSPRRGLQPSPSRRLAAAEPTNGHSDSTLDAEQVLSGLIALKKGDFKARLPLAWTGISGKVADTFNEVAEMLSHSTDELSRISRVVGLVVRIQERVADGNGLGDWSVPSL